MHRLLWNSIFLLATGAFLAAPLGASPPQTNPQVFTGVQTAPSPNLLNSGLLDFSRFNLRHSLSYSHVSSGFGSSSAGLWVTSLGYRASEALQVSADVGALINPTGDGPVLSENSFFLRGVNVNYRPSRNFMLNISYVNVPASAPYGMGGPGYGFGYRPWGSPLGLNR